MNPSPASGTVAQKVLQWHRKGLRRTFPWQLQTSPYSVWVSEIMLQQTQAETVVNYFPRFMDAFPDVAALAATDQDAVLHLWSGLGYYGRARNLHRSAQILAAEHGGNLPDHLPGLMGLPGIGRSTAGAILALGFGHRGVILDGNVKRVLARLHAVAGSANQSAWLRRLWELAEGHTPAEAGLCGDYAQAMMNLGAVLCLPRQPDCGNCPLVDDCRAHALGRQLEFPAKAARKARPEKRAGWLLVLDSDGNLMLEQRPSVGLWGGLWTLPELAADEQPQAGCQRLTGCRPQSSDSWREVRHRFTHFDLRAQVHLLRLPPAAATMLKEDSCKLVAPAQALRTLALPTPVRRLLEELAADSQYPT